jgi:hypothetical protein
LYSLSRKYQRGIDDITYEVLAVDSNSSLPLEPRSVAMHAREFTHYSHESPNPSPVNAINWAAGLARGRYLAVLVDGARILSPGVLQYAASATRIWETPFVYTLGWHLGPDIQNRSMMNGYDRAAEDRLLEESHWEDDGYRLFDISVLAGSSLGGFLGDISESNLFLLERDAFLRMGGMDARFVSPGGGLANLDFFSRVLEMPELMQVRLLGEGTFHQFHDGVASNALPEKHPWAGFAAEYEAIRGRQWQMPAGQTPVLLGPVSSRARRFIV